MSVYRSPASSVRLSNSGCCKFYCTNHYSSWPITKFFIFRGGSFVLLDNPIFAVVYHDMAQVFRFSATFGKQNFGLTAHSSKYFFARYSRYTPNKFLYLSWESIFPTPESFFSWPIVPSNIGDWCIIFLAQFAHVPFFFFFCWCYACIFQVQCCVRRPTTI